MTTPGFRRTSIHSPRPSLLRFRIASWLCGALAAAPLPAFGADTADPGVTEIVGNPADPGASCPPPDGTRPDPSLINVDPFVLERFPLRRVLSQFIAQAHARRTSAEELYQRLWDSMDAASSGKFKGPHCDANNATLNGFPLECPRPEVTLVDTPPELFEPLALVNRFDLAPADGANCGEYRIVYGMKPFSEENRNLIILEGVLPNPNPSCGIEACRPVVEFWESLSAYDPSSRGDRRALASRLEHFYFRGIPGFGPILHPDHFGLSGRGGYGGPNGGQIRTNMFVLGTTWQLREFHLARACDRFSCELYFDPAAVGDNPYPQMFDFNNASPIAKDFRESFIPHVEALLSDDVTAISLDMDARFNAAQSTSTGFDDDYAVQMINGLQDGPNDFTRAIRAELTRLGRTDVSPLDIAERASSQSCAGCHMVSAGMPLSGNGTEGPVWPDVRPGGFVHIDEDRNLSPALWCTFLPFRKSVLDAVYENPGQACASGATSVAAGPARKTLVSVGGRGHHHAPYASGLTITGRPFGPN